MMGRRWWARGDRDFRLGVLVGPFNRFYSRAAIAWSRGRAIATRITVTTNRAMLTPYILARVRADHRTIF